MKNSRLTVACVVAAGISVTGVTALMPVRQACAQQQHEHMSFQEDIVPILKGWCVSCHMPGGEGFKASGVDLTSYEGLMKGTKFGPVVIPKDPDGSTLIALIYGRASPQIRMPYGHKPLPDCLRTNFWGWIFDGAKNN
jgi:Planctomycete cytochrome C